MKLFFTDLHLLFGDVYLLRTSQLHVLPPRLNLIAIPSYLDLSLVWLASFFILHVENSHFFSYLVKEPWMRQVAYSILSYIYESFNKYSDFRAEAAEVPPEKNHIEIIQTNVMHGITI